MKRRVSIRLVAGAAAAAVSMQGCSALDNAISSIDALTAGCDEFAQGPSTIGSLPIDSATKAFVAASASLTSLVWTAEGNVLGACVVIDDDLGVTDTWSALASDGGGPPDAEVTEACKQAAAKIHAVLSTSAQAGCSLVVSPAHCTVDENQEVQCESSCASSTMCQQSCKYAAESRSTCTPAEAQIECAASGALSSEVQAVIKTVATNLPALLLVLAQGPLAVDAANNVEEMGGAVLANASSLNGKAISCATTAASADSTAAASMNTTANACTAVGSACGSIQQTTNPAVDAGSKAAMASGDAGED